MSTEGRSRTARRSLRSLTSVLLLALSAGGLAAEPNEAPTTDCRGVLPSDLRAICERGELRVARYGGDRPPFFFQRDGEWVGFDVDLGRDIARRLGLRYSEDPTAASFDSVVDRVAVGAADLGISKLSGTLQRAQRVRFSNAYLTVYQALLVNRLSSPSRGDPFEALNADGFKIGALAGSAYVGYGQGLFALADVRPYSDFTSMMADVVEARIDAALMDSARANTWRQANRESLIHVRTTIDRSRKDPLAIAVAWENTHLLAWVNLYLQRIKADGTAEALYSKWFDTAATDEAAPKP